MGFDTLLTISLTLEEKAQLYATSQAFGMSGMGAVVRAVMDGRLPPLHEMGQIMNPNQRNVYYDAYEKYKGVYRE